VNKDKDKDKDKTDLRDVFSFDNYQTNINCRIMGTCKLYDLIPYIVFFPFAAWKLEKLPTEKQFSSG
jgi:hypothetical protein